MLTLVAVFAAFLVVQVGMLVPLADFLTRQLSGEMPAGGRRMIAPAPSAA